MVYGDTDSMFVLLKGRSTEEAFKIGEEIADVITKMNPPPVRTNERKKATSVRLSVSVFVIRLVLPFLGGQWHNAYSFNIPCLHISFCFSGKIEV